MPTQTFALIDDTFADFLADDLLVKPALATWERQDYYTLRRAVFSDEQQLLAQDRDEKTFRRFRSLPWRITAACPNGWSARYASMKPNRASGTADVCAWSALTDATA